MNYQKSILGFIAVVLLSAIASADGTATYLPLTTATKDGSWIFFGVNGFSDGRASSRSAVASGFSAGYIEIEDSDPQDEYATWGLSALGTPQPALDNLMSVQGIDDSTISTLKVATELLQPFVAEEPIRSMYIRVNSVTPNVKIDYKASLEGQTLEIFVGSISPLYSAIISQDNTYNNPAEAIVSVRVAASVTKLSSITDVIDYQLGNNPLDAKYFSKTDHQDDSDSLSTPVKTATFYHFDAKYQQWKIWNTHFSGVANDFTEFSKGEAYWGIIDVDDNPANNDGTVGSGVTDSDGNDILGSGLVLGKSGEAVPDPGVYRYDDNSSKLREGWNMLAFDDVRPYIRRASTGLVATSLESAGDIILSDSTGINSIQITLSAVAVNLQATEINRAIELAKLKGTLPKSFNIRVFSSDTTTNPKRLIFICDSKFSIEDESGADNITIVETLTGSNPYNESSVQTETFSNLDTATAGQKIATSAYGEYSLIVDIMTDDLAGVDTAATLDFVGGGSGDYDSARLAFGTESKDYAPIPLDSVNDSQPDASTVKISIESHTLFDKNVHPIDSYGKAIELDSLNDGSEDKMIITSTTPFYIKDSTYTRVFDYNETTGNDARTFEVIGSQKFTVKPTAAQAVTDVASYINDNADTNEERTGVYAGVDGTKLVLVSTTLSTLDVKDLEDGNYEFLKSTISDSDIAKGAVAGVYALDTVAKMPLIQHSFSFDTIIVPDNNLDSIAISIDLGTATPTNASDAFADASNDTTDTTERLAYFDKIVENINADIVTDNKHAYAYHDYTTAVDDFAGTKITIEGLDAHHITFSMFGGEASPSLPIDANDGIVATLGTSWTAITSDLKSNAIYTPNFVARGPLYTLREAGFDVKAMLKATTNVTDMSIGWDSIDVTRDESDWFRNNEFNLFSTDVNSGYWVYLETKVADSVVISSPSYRATYTYYFDNIDSNGEYITKNIINGGQFSVQIEGVNNQISTAYVSINGEEVQLKRSGTSDEFTADFTTYALKSLNEDLTGPISMTIRATNGKGEADLKKDAYTFDYTAPILDPPTAPDKYGISFTADGNVTKFYVYNKYIPELYSSRVDADAQKNRFVGSYDASLAGGATAKLCKELRFGDVDDLRVIAADGTGEIGFVNLSNAQQFKYATMLKSSHVLKDAGGDSNETSIGERYDSTCELLANQPVLATDNNGVSVKVVHDNNLTARFVYEVIDGITLSTSMPWTSAYSVGGESVIHVKSLIEYKSKPFFLQYNNKIYVSAFPATSDAASASLDSNVTAILLDDVTEFVLDGDGDSIGGSGNEISILNNALLIP